jgi:ribosomal protein S18 acetylase RimI-like enzyme
VPISHDSDKLAERIVPATEDDWPWILEGQVEIAWARLGAERRKQENRQTVAKSVVLRVQSLRKDDGFPNQALVAWTPEGTRAGFVWVAKSRHYATGQPEASLLNQFVAEPCRGQGLGERLMKAAEEWAREQGLPRISLCVAMQDALGQRLYKSLGYQAEAVRMIKKLMDPPGVELPPDHC